ncbi:hypothetical protein ACFL6M_01530 [Candidatus Eisenbacteria bacterium]|uniref:Transposase DDE domain-containing protein n=1 Tax=Eiseniibacteriota bacterium TaxID=2212470 RepID=A0ABV6YIU3_UNCEI
MEVDATRVEREDRRRLERPMSIGNGQNETVRIAAARFGLVHCFRQQLGFFSKAAVFHPFGDRNGNDVASGIFYCVMETPGYRMTRRMSLLR